MAAVRQYLPDELFRENAFWCDRRYFWKVLFHAHGAWANKYYRQVMDFHHSKPKVNPKTKMIKITDDWLAKLREFDFTSKNGKKQAVVNILVPRAPREPVSQGSNKRSFVDFLASQGLAPTLANQSSGVGADVEMGQVL